MSIVDMYKVLLDSINYMFLNSITYDGRLTKRNKYIIFKAISGLLDRYYKIGYINLFQYEYIKYKNITFYNYRG